MHTANPEVWQHDHTFDLDQRQAGESRTLIVVVLTAVMMVVEISAGIYFGSMALLADGLHMGSHATALGLAVFAYVISRRLARDNRFSFGVGKINSLAGFASAVMLLGFALIMVVESVDRLISPTAIAFDQALIVAVIGLLVNGGSAWILASTPHSHGHDHGHVDDADHHHHDHNLRGAYLHVIADALTSFLAIFALLAGKYFGAVWLDPVMGFVGAALVARWSFGLIRESARVLLDHEPPPNRIEALRKAIEADTTDRVTDLHYWSIGHNIYAAEIAIVTHDRKSPQHYKSLIPAHLNIVHATVELHDCEDPRDDQTADASAASG